MIEKHPADSIGFKPILMELKIIELLENDFYNSKIQKKTIMILLGLAMSDWS